MTDFHIGVVAHPKREKWVCELDEQKIPDYVSWDQDGAGAGMNHLRTLRAMRQRWQTGWLVVLEDDCQPVPGLREQLDMALDAAPSPIVSLYCGTGYPAQYQRAFSDTINDCPDVPWLMHKQLRHAVGYALHTEITRAAMPFIEKCIMGRFAPDDAISGFALGNGIMVAYTNPSLVDHRDVDTVIDVRMHLGHPQAPGRKRPRKAYKVGTRLTWEDKCVNVGPL